MLYLIVRAVRHVVPCTVFAAPCVVHAQKAPVAEFVLEEVAAVKLPAGITVNGAALLTKNEVIFWNERARFRWDVVGGTIGPLPCTAPNARVVAVGEMMSNRGLLLVSNPPRKSLILHPGSTCSPVKAEWTRSLQYILSEGSMRDHQLVVASARRIHVLEFKDHQAPQIVDVPLSSGLASAWSIPSQPLRLGSARDYTALANSSGVWLSELHFPFRALRIDSTARVVDLIDPTRGVEVSERTKYLQGWVSSGLRVVHPGFLMMLADPSTDRRTMLILDARGRVLRKKDLDVALAFLSVGSRDQRIVAIRDVGELEIVLYAWRWRANPQSTGGFQ